MKTRHPSPTRIAARSNHRYENRHKSAIVMPTMLASNNTAITYTVTTTVKYGRESASMTDTIYVAKNSSATKTVSSPTIMVQSTTASLSVSVTINGATTSKGWSATVSK